MATPLKLDDTLVEDILADWRRLNVTGRIVWSTTGGPLRTIVTGTKCKPTGVYNSVKTGHAQPYESQFELRFMKICEADWHVINWLAQPHRIEIVHDGKWLTYFPDIVLERTNGAVEVIEIKRNKTDEVRRDVELKLRLAAEFYSAIGFKFKILDTADISIEPLFSNAEEVQRHAHTTVPPAERFTLLRRISLSGEDHLPFGKIVEFLGGGIAGRKKLCSLIVRRYLAIDLTEVLNEDTPVFRQLSPKK